MLCESLTVAAGQMGKFRKELGRIASPLQTARIAEELTRKPRRTDVWWIWRASDVP
jgi:hypothetical protein